MGSPTTPILYKKFNIEDAFGEHTTFVFLLYAHFRSSSMLKRKKEEEKDKDPKMNEFDQKLRKWQPFLCQAYKSTCYDATGLSVSKL